MKNIEEKILELIEAEAKAENERAKRYIELNPSDRAFRENIRSSIVGELNYIACQIRTLCKA